MHARHLSKSGQRERAFELLRDAVVCRAYGCAHTLTSDPWFLEVRRHPRFGSLLEAARETEARASAEFQRARGSQVLHLK